MKHLTFFLLSLPIFFLHAQVPEMVLVRGGTFIMGCTPEQERDCSRVSFPTRSVSLPNFYIGKYEITQAEWKAILGNNTWGNPDCGENCPAENISWYNALVYCNALSEQEGLTPCYYSNETFTEVYAKLRGNWILPDTGKIYWLESANGYRLPTDAEWEYTARGGLRSKGYKYAGSNNIDEVAWFSDNSGSNLHEVGQKLSNELGIFDMTGNVDEFTWDDGFDGWGFDNSDPICFPSVKNGDFAPNTRGCSYGSGAEFCLISRNGWANADLKYSFDGFRIARNY